MNEVQLFHRNLTEVKTMASCHLEKHHDLVLLTKFGLTYTRKKGMSMSMQDRMGNKITSQESQILFLKKVS